MYCLGESERSRLTICVLELQMARLNKALAGHIEVVLPSQFAARLAEKFGPATITLGSVTNGDLSRKDFKQESIVTPEGNVVSWDIPPTDRTFRWFGQGRRQLLALYYKQ